MHCNAELYYVGKIPRTGVGRPSKQRRVVLRRNTVVGGKCALPSAFLVVLVRIENRDFNFVIELSIDYFK